MRPFPLTTLQGGINRLSVKGSASANRLYDLVNAYITNDGTVSPREGTVRAQTLDTNSVGLMCVDGVFNIFGSTYTTSTATVPAGYQLNLLINPVNSTATPTTIWFAKPFMGFPFVTAQFSDGSVYDYWLQSNGAWTSNTVYSTGNIVTPDTPNGLAYLAVRDFPQQPLWTANTLITSGSYVEPNEYTGYAYQAIAVAGTNPHTGAAEPVWPTISAGQLQEFGDFDTSQSDAGTTQATSTTASGPALGTNITDRYGDSIDIAGAGTPAPTTLTLTTASTKVTTWQAGTLYAPGAVVIPTNTQGAFTNAIPNGDFEAGNDGNWTFTNVGGSAAWTITNTGVAYQGSYCAQISGGTIGGSGAFCTMTTYSPVTPGQSVTASAYLDPNNAGANLTLWLQLNWYDSSDIFLSATGNQQNEQEGGGYRKVSVTGSAPPGAAHCRLSIGAGSGTSGENAGFADLVLWNLEQAATISNFLYEAVQSAPASSGTAQPTWPTVNGTTVLDGGVTWEAIGTSIITWEAIPLMQSGASQPVFSTIVGNTVHDPSTFTNANGYLTSACSMSWQCISRVISDINDPHTIPTTLGASHVFKGNKDIVSYSAAVNPTDFTSTDNAGYLPTGLNNYGDNPVAVLTLYRSNLVVLNAGGYQMWQIDPDPANMALLDAQPVGSIWPRAAQSVANDLLFLTEVGVRNLATLGATANMAIGNTGQPIDPLIAAQLSGVPIYPIPGVNYDPFFSQVGLLLTNGYTDVSLNELPYTIPGTGVSLSTSVKPFGTESIDFAGTGVGVNNVIQYPATAGGPLDLSGGTWTVEFWIQGPTPPFAGEGVVLVLGSPTGAPVLEVFFKQSGGSNAFISILVGAVGTGSNSIIFPVNTWVAVAIVSTAYSTQIFINGVASGAPIPWVFVSFLTNILALGNAYDGSTPLTGYIANVRITKGVARYSSNYTPVTQPFITNAALYTPISLYYPGRGQYWLIFGPQAFVLTINGQGTRSWSRYLFPDTITDWALNAGTLYLRTAGNLVWQFTAQVIGLDDASTITTGANAAFNGVIQWPYLNVGALGLNKMLVGVDIVGDGNVSIQVAFNQSDKTSFNDNPNFTSSTSVTAPYFVAITDTVPGEPLPIPCNAPSYSVILTFAGSSTSANAWTWEALNLYLSDQGGGGATG